MANENLFEMIAQLIGALVMVVGMIAIPVLLFAAADGYVVSKLWNWIIVPIFGLKSLTWVQAYGVCLVIRVINGAGGKQQAKEKREGKEAWEHLGKYFLNHFFGYLPMILLIGWIIKHFIQGG